MVEPDPSAILSRPLMTLSLAVGTIHTLDADRRVGVLTGGTFEGARLRGLIEPGSSDWQTLLDDGVTLLDVRMVLRTDDGALIAMTYAGVRHGPADVMARLGRGEPVDPSDYYFRITASFSANDERYAWLNKIVAIGTGERLPEGPVYRIHELL